MEAAGAAIKDILPIPDNTEALSAEREEVSYSLDEKPTASHALAVADHDEKGHAQTTHDAEDVKDLGWNEPGDKIANPLVGGMRNEDLWLLIRRFNKQMYHVKEYPYSVPGNLDLNIADVCIIIQIITTYVRQLLMTILHISRKMNSPPTS